MNVQILVIYFCIFFLFTPLSQASACYDLINDGGLGTTYYVQENTPFAAPYACQLSRSNVVHEDSKYTFSVKSANDSVSCGEIISIPGTLEKEKKRRGQHNSKYTFSVEVQEEKNYVLWGLYNSGGNAYNKWDYCIQKYDWEEKRKRKMEERGERRDTERIKKR